MKKVLLITCLLLTVICKSQSLLTPHRFGATVAGQNLWLQSEDFATTWATEFITIMADNALAPDGTTTADLLTCTGGSTVGHRTGQSYSGFVSGTTYVISVYAKAGTNNYIQLLYSSIGFPANAYANFDLANGIVGTVGAGATATITAAANGYYRCSIAATCTSTTSTSGFFYIVPASNSARAASANMSTTVWLWGGQLNTGSLKTYQKTTTAAIP